MGKLWSWFRDSQTPRSVRDLRAVRAVASRAAREDEAIRAAQYYVFYYPEGREPGSGWRSPKAYFGPFSTKTAADEGLTASWPAKAGEPRARFQIKKLTADQFVEIWGARPGRAAEGY